MVGCARIVGVVVLVGWASLATAAPQHVLVKRETDTGTVCGYRDTPIQPWTGGKYRVHDPDRPIPKFVVPGESSTQDTAGSAPSDAIRLFYGRDLSGWEPSKWTVADGCIEAGEGSLTTKEAFGDCQLHVEWMVPAGPPSHMMSRGNSGVFLMGLYEIQIFDSHPSHVEQIYPDGQAASIYAQTPPLVNACREPGEWQSFDIVFTAPRFDGEKLAKPATATVFHNGVLVHLNQEIMGPTEHCHVTPYQPHPAKLPLAFQGHHSPVRFRNVWIRPLEK